MIRIADCEQYLDTKLKKPNIIDPAVYVDLGMDSLSIIPYKVINTGNLKMYGDELFEIHPSDTYFKLLVEHNGNAEDFYIINKYAASPNNIGKNSHNNHLKFGYGKIPLLGLPKLPFSETVGIPDVDRQSWWEECKNAARLIKQKYGNVILSLSGGIDSELMVCAFLDAGLKFDVYLMKYVDTKGNLLNTYDYTYAKEFCNNNNIKPIEDTVHLVDDIIQRRHRDYYIKDVPETHFLLSNLYTQNLMIEKLTNEGWAVIMGSDQVEIKMDANNTPSIGETSFSLGLAAPTWAHFTNKPCVYDFFYYTPNQIFSYFDIEEVQNTKIVDYDFKDYISRKYGSARLGPKRNKSSGYEKTWDAFFNIGKVMHEYTIENIDFVDWDKRANTQYIHNIDHVLKTGKFDQWKIIRTTTNDFFCRGFAQNDKRYYDL
jgi:hypothetical protein